MSEFFLWFIRPIAEFLGGMALVASLFAISFVCFVVYDYLWIRKRKKKE